MPLCTAISNAKSSDLTLYTILQVTRMFSFTLHKYSLLNKYADVKKIKIKKLIIVK